MRFLGWPPCPTKRRQISVVSSWCHLGNLKSPQHPPAAALGVTHPTSQSPAVVHGIVKTFHCKATAYEAASEFVVSEWDISGQRSTRGPW